jgi:hypothetical protein
MQKYTSEFAKYLKKGIEKDVGVCIEKISATSITTLGELEIVLMKVADEDSILREFPIYCGALLQAVVASMFYFYYNL